MDYSAVCGTASVAAAKRQQASHWAGKISKQLLRGTVSKTHQDDDLSNGPWETTIEYHAPFFKTNRGEGHRVAWAIFEQANQ